MNLRHLSGLARPLELDYPTNRWIGALALAVLAFGWLFRGLVSGAWLASGAWAGLAALAVFLAWALCRELDPDRERVAFLAAALALIGLAVTGLPDIAGLFALLLAVRVLNRTTGIPATPLDALLLFALAFWLAFEGAWLYLLLAVAALVLDGLLAPRSLLRVGTGLAAGVLVGGALAAVGAEAQAPEPQGLAILLAVVLAAVFAIAIRAVAGNETKADVTGERLSPARVRAGQLLALAAGFGLVLWRGGDGLAEQMPLWAAMAAAGIGRLADRAR